MASELPFDFSLLDFKSTIDVMPVCVVFITPEGRFGYVSPEFYQLHRLPPDTQVVGTRVVDWLASDESPEVIQRMQAGPTEASIIKSTVYRLARSDNTLFLSEISSVPLHGRDGRFLGLVSVMRDVTNAKLLEQQLQQNFERQEFLNHLLQLLYRPRDLLAALAQVLELIGIFTRASRVSLMENTPDDATACVTMEWSDEEKLAQAAGEPQVDKFVCVDFSEAPSLRIFAEARGVVCVPSEATTPPDLLNLVDKWDLKSFVALPVFGMDRLFGLIVVEFARERRTWSVEDLDLMRNISRTISNAIARTQVEETEYVQRVLVETLRDITSVVNSDFTFSQVLDYILSNLNRIVPHSASSILLMDDQGHLKVAHTYGFPPGKEDVLRAMHAPLNRWKTIDLVAHSNQPVIVGDTLKQPNWELVPDLNWVRSYMGSAIRSRGKLLGILNVDATTVEAFTGEHAVRLQAFADQAAVAIENAMLYQEAQRRAEQMTTLYEIGLTLASGLELDQVLASLHEQVARVLPFDVFYVGLYNETSEILQFPLFIERGERVVVATRNVADVPGISGRVISTRQTHYLQDIKDPETASRYPAPINTTGLSRAYVGVPLIAREHVVGIISMQSYQPGIFSLEQVRLLETIANQAALAIDNAHIFIEMRQLAITDSLTGLFNRRHFTELGQVEVDRALRYERGLGVLMVDIDSFKRVNDNLGHNAGDAVLQEISRICRTLLRSSDIIGRYGGEEFAIVLPELDEERSLRVAERIRAVIDATSIETPKGPVHITLSIGVVLLRPEFTTLEILLDCADRAMYQAKQAGRNRVNVFSKGVA